MSLAAAAAAMGIPEALVQRSAAARAAETGASVDDVLAAWAGGQAPPAAPAAPPSEAPADTPAPAPEEQPATAAPPEPEVAAPVIAAPSASRTPTRAPIPDEVTPGEATQLPEVITVPTAGIRERTNFVIPKWLTAVILIVPFVALYALGGSATGECGEATELQADVVTGQIVNCDGSQFTGQQIDGGGEDFVALGEQVYAGGAVTGVNCSGCHGPNGQGVGNFPALTGVMTTFGSCADQVTWVELGSSNWPDATYGDTNKPVGGGMPGFVGSLSAEQLAAVVAFERVRHAGADEEQTLADCGLVESPEGGEEGTEGESEGGEGDATESGGDVEASAAQSG